MYKFNIITTYLNGEQDIFDIQLDDMDVVDDENFLYTLFEGETNLDSIIKYSVLQVCEEDEMLPFLRDRNGKYFFDESDQEALDFKNNFIASGIIL
jgi:hypothetical protein